MPDLSSVVMAGEMCVCVAGLWHCMLAESGQPLQLRSGPTAAGRYPVVQLLLLHQFIGPGCSHHDGLGNVDDPAV